MKKWSWWLLLWLLPLAGLGLTAATRNLYYMALFTPGLLLIAGIAIGRRDQTAPGPKWLWVAWAGLAATMIGDYFLVFRHAGLASNEFLGGVGGFCLAQILWIAFFARNYRINREITVALLICCGILLGVRLRGALPSGTLLLALSLYTALSACSVGYACGSRRHAFILGIGALLFSDLMIGYGQILKIAPLKPLVGVFYLLALIAITIGIVGASRQSPLRRWTDKLTYLRRMALLACCGGTLAIVCFALAIYCYPNGLYNPFRQMLSVLGRVRVNGFLYPLSNYFFVTGMAVSAVAIWYFIPAFHCFAVEARRRSWIRWGLAMTGSGLLAIAFIPEDFNSFFHNAGCCLAAIGGGLAVLAVSIKNESCRFSRLARYCWCGWLLGVVAVFELFLGLHGIRQLPFSPYVPCCQKVLIVSFIVWMMAYALVLLRDSGALRLWRFRLALILLAAILLSVVVPIVRDRLVSPRPVGPETAVDRQWYDRPLPPLTDDELAAQNYLAATTFRLPPADREYWNIGGDQLGTLAVRYNLAFAGYAAAMLGLRTPAYPELTSAMLKNCIERMLQKPVWSYIERYWKKKSWFPDPCYDENIMYTGHLLQLLALYEFFSRDPGYHTQGFDFVWSPDRVIHYNVEKLIAVTVRQMRANPSGGVSCEPNLIFFPCNNHPQIALRLFEKLGYGDWRHDRAKWEDWALRRYRDPLLGGGAIRLVYDRSKNITLPEGHTGLDGWTLLWYHAWAQDLNDVRLLWQESLKSIDWTLYANDPHDFLRKKTDCCHPIDVPPVTTASFMAAAARVMGDPATAERFEAFTDKFFLRRDHGQFRLETNREWRPGATANRIIALAAQHGSNMRDATIVGLPPDYYQKLYLAHVQPEAVRVAAAWRGADGVLHLTLRGNGGPAVLTLAHAPASLRIAPAAGVVWNPTTATLSLAHVPERLELTVAP